MEQQKASGVAVEQLPAIRCSLRTGTGFGVAPKARSRPLGHDLARRSMTDE
jgi:hypothetical protein